MTHYYPYYLFTDNLPEDSEWQWYEPEEEI